MESKNVGIVTPLALQSLPVEFHLSYLANIQYLQLNADRLPFKVKSVRMIAPHTFPIDANRNESIAWIKKWDIDITVWLDADQDIMNYADDRKPTTIFNLLKNGYEYPVYAGIYYLKKPPYHPIIFKANDDFDVFSPIWKFPKDQLFWADMIGMGCCKIDRSIINKLDKPYFEYNPIPAELAGSGDLARFKYENGVNDVSEDVAFWRQVRRKTGTRVVVDPGIQVGHVSKYVVTQSIFEAHMEANKDMALKQMGEKKFNNYWESICQAETLKNDNYEGMLKYQQSERLDKNKILSIEN